MNKLSESTNKEILAIMQQIEEIRQRIKNDVSAYYFDNIFEIISNLNESDKHLKIAQAALNFATSYANFYQAKDLSAKEYNERLEQLDLSLDNFINLTQDHKIWQAIKKPVQIICQIIIGVVLGTVGALVGLVSGFVKGCTQKKNPLAVAFQSSLASAAIGGIAGKRIPEQVFNNRERAKLGATLNRLKYIHKRLKAHVATNDESLDQQVKSQDIPEIPKGKEGMFLSDEELEAFVKQKIISQCFADSTNPEQAFSKFLDSKQAIQICTQKAVFNMKHLKGSLGHHALIRIAIDDHELQPIEFGIPHKHSPALVDQAEEMRIVSGKQLFQMMVTHERMKHIQAFSFEFMVDQYKPGEYDCRSYVNQIIQSVGLKRTKINRFVAQLDSNTGTYLHKPLLSNSCLFTQDELNLGVAELPIHNYSREGYQAFQDKHWQGNKPPTRKQTWELQREYTGFSKDVRRTKIEEAMKIDIGQDPNP